MSMIQELRYTDRHRVKDSWSDLRHSARITFINASKNYDPSQFINEYLRKKSLGETATLARLVGGGTVENADLDAVTDAAVSKLSSAAASGEDNGEELSFASESRSESGQDEDLLDDKQMSDDSSPQNSSNTPVDIPSEYGKSGIADDEKSDSDSESELPLPSVSHGEQGSDVESNHSSDMNYDELIGLKNLALRDLDGGDNVDFGSSSETDDELTLDEEDTYDNEDDVALGTDYESVLDEISEIRGITRTMFGPGGRIFILALSGKDNEVEVTESQLYAYFKKHRGLSRSEMRRSITELGGEPSGDEDEEEEDDEDDDDDDDYDISYEGYSSRTRDGPMYDEALENILENSNLDDEELDNIIRALVGGDPRALNVASTSKNPKRSKAKAPQFDLSDEELQDYLTLQWHKSREAKRTKRREREVLHQRGLLRGPKCDIGQHHIDLRREYPEKMHINDIVSEFQKFLISPFAQQMIFPPMDSHGRWTIKELSKAFKVSATSQQGKGMQKHVVCSKSPRSDLANADMTVVNKIWNRRRLFPRSDLARAPDGRKKDPKTRRAGGGGPKHHREGEIVGGNASEIGVENVGRQLLEKMGWKSGMSLGTTTVGILEPISAVVKRTKWGLGKEVDVIDIA